MKSGILREDEGFDIFVDGVRRTFRDVKHNAYEAARLVKSKCQGKVEVLDRSTGRRIEMQADGRTA